MGTYLVRQTEAYGLRRTVHGVAFAQPQNIIGGDGVTNIVVLPQAQWDAMYANGTLSDTTVYLTY